MPQARQRLLQWQFGQSCEYHQTPATGVKGGSLNCAVRLYACLFEYKPCHLKRESRSGMVALGGAGVLCFIMQMGRGGGRGPPDQMMLRRRT